MIAQPHSPNRPGSRALRSVLASALALHLLAAAVLGQVQVRTLGGGPSQGNPNYAGFVNGSTFAIAQFNHPLGLARDSIGNLYIADRNNSAVRKVTVPGNDQDSITSTFAGGLNQPVGVAIDSSDHIYVLTRGDGRIRKYDKFGNLLSTLSDLLTLPQAIALDATSNLYVAEHGGQVKRITPSGTVSVLAGGFNQPQGIAVLRDGSIAVSDTGNHRIQLIHPDLTLSTLAGGTAGFADGTGSAARFFAPQQIATAPNGALVVADRYNHRVRLVATNGMTTTLYGVDPAQWVPSDFTGWWDGTAEFAEAREPAGITVAPNGTVYTTEVFYHILRQVTGTGLSAPPGGGDPGNGGGDTNGVVVVTPPAISPNSGYFPNGQVITVTSDSSTVFYTMDGSEPTPNSLQVSMNGNLGQIFWRNPTNDLRALRLKAFVGMNSSVTVSGQPSSSNQIGVPGNIIAGSGSTAFVPVVLNLRENDQLKSIHFRVEVTPLGGAPALTLPLRALSLSSNDFVQVVTPAQGGETATFSWLPYEIAPTRGLAISAVGTNSNFEVRDFAVAALLAVPIPGSAQPGQSYSIGVLYPSGTSDGVQAEVPLNAMPLRSIQIQNISYTVGDSAPGAWYNAGDFGDGNLSNSDVNNAFYASLGFRLPDLASDAFDAMDTFPRDTPGQMGGDGAIRFLDWQVILLRSLRLETENWKRSWSPGGVRVSSPAGLAMSASQSDAEADMTISAASGEPEGGIWVRQAVMGAIPLTNVVPGQQHDFPVFVRVADSASLGGLSFRSILSGDGTAPSPAQGLQFIPAAGLPAPMQASGATPNDLLCGWPLVPSPSFSPSLQGSNLLGWIRFRVPSGAQAGQSYTLRFSHSDGSPDSNTQYDFENLSASAWVLSSAQHPPDPISDEWKIHFFGSADAPMAQAEADADGDGLTNLEEYLAGTDPTDPLSRLQFISSQPSGGSGQNGIVLRWLTAPGKRYAIDQSPTLIAPAWSVVAENLMGDGHIQEYLDTNPSQPTRFYRLRLQP